MKTMLITWIVSALSILSPVHAATIGRALPGWEETAVERETRYQAIASDLHDVVFDTNEEPLRGQTREGTARILAAIAWHESALAKDVDIGPCYRGKNHEGRCDSGRSVCLMQLYAPTATSTVSGFTRAQLESDRKTCFRAALHVARRSYATCREAGTELNLYATGRCAFGTRNTRMKQATAARIPHAPAVEVVAGDL